MTTYDIELTREGRWWMVAIPAIDGLTQVRRLSEVEAMARSYIAVTLDVAPSSVEVGRTSIVVDNLDVTAVAGDVAFLREVAAEKEAAAGQLIRSIALSLASSGVPLRDIGTILGVSHQRVAQVLDAAGS